MVSVDANHKYLCVGTFRKVYKFWKKQEIFLTGKNKNFIPVEMEKWKSRSLENNTLASRNYTLKKGFSLLF